MHELAVDANLVGADEDLVEDVLGPATFVYSEWSETNARTGEPTVDAVYSTTYKFAPYPLLPLDDTFEVHCRDGKVVSIELFDD